MQERVDLLPDLVMYYNVFTTLSTSRQSGMGLGYIGYSTITDFLNEEGYTGFERQECRRWVQIIDRIYVKLHSEKEKSEREKKSSQPTSQRQRR